MEVHSPGRLNSLRLGGVAANRMLGYPMAGLVLLILFSTITCYVVASRVYGRYLERVLGVNPARPTPAHTHADDRDYVPSKPHVLFAHHFAAIAGAGPIVGPTLAFTYGVIPGLLWVVLGAIFLGGVHDLSVLMISVREGGRSVAEITRSVLGKAGFGLMVTFLIVCLLMITAVFLNLSINALTSSYPAARVGLAEPTQAEMAAFAAKNSLPDASYPASAWMPTRVSVAAPKVAESKFAATGDELAAAAPAAGATYFLEARIGGIASTSVFIITFVAPLLGWLIYRRRASSWLTYPLATALCVTAVMLGLKFPVTANAEDWRWMMTVYVLLASSIPVWLLLMPRDFVNVQILYAGIFGVFAALLLAAFGLSTNLPALSEPAAAMPLFNLAEGAQAGPIWPMLLITISCGAISGFHCLVSGGTSAKQLDNERAARPVAYWAMLLESLLAVTVILTLYLCLKHDVYMQIARTENNPILAIALATGYLIHGAFGLPIWLGTVFGILLLEGFIVTTLDAAVRLNRYLFEELWRVLLREPPAWAFNPWLNTGLAVLAMFFLSRSQTVTVLWRVFGTANQMMAAMALLVVTLWLRAHGRRYWFALIPCVAMFVTTFAAAWLNLQSNWAAKNWVLAGASVAMMLLACGVILLAARSPWRPPAAQPA